MISDFRFLHIYLSTTRDRPEINVPQKQSAHYKWVKIQGCNKLDFFPLIIIIIIIHQTRMDDWSDRAQCIGYVVNMQVRTDEE